MQGDLVVTGDTDADKLLNTDPLALLLGMLLDQQVPIEWAFRGPSTLANRLGHLDATRIAAMSEDEVVATCCEKPAVHRFPAVMGRRIHALCTALTEDYDGDAEAVWRGVDDAAVLQQRLVDLPGFGPEKTAIFVALLAKRFGVTPRGWEAVAGPFADSMPRSVADLDSAEAFTDLRARRSAQKTKGKSKTD
jgi:uncharacterized HhH-GPD family protein